MLTVRENLSLFGHQEAKRTFLKTFHSPRFPHGWIIGGPCGIGKATFAFHMARYILSGRQDGNTLFTEKEPLQRRIMAQSHGDLQSLGGDETPEISIDAIRKAGRFLTQTPAEGGWRVLIIDGADKLNRHAANALLKRLEEPPPQTAFFLITSLLDRLLPTIRSRCQILPLKPLKNQEVEDVLKSQGVETSLPLSLAEGSPGRLMRLSEKGGTMLYQDLQKILKGAPPAPFIHTYGAEDASFSLVENLLRTFLHDNLLEKLEGGSSLFKDMTLEKALNIYEKIAQLFDYCHLTDLDQKTTLMCVFDTLAQRNRL